jgi:hypothetical protein
VTAPRPSGKAEQDDARRALAELSVPSEPGNERLAMEGSRSEPQTTSRWHNILETCIKMRFFGYSTAGTKGDLEQTLPATGKPNFHQDRLRTVACRVCGKVPSVRQCQK